jgi:hypothetical protein
MGYLLNLQIKMANSNIEYLKEYLNQQLDSTYDEIREVESRLHTNTTGVNTEYGKLVFRKAWILNQLNNIYFNQA